MDKISFQGTWSFTRSLRQLRGEFERLIWSFHNLYVHYAFWEVSLGGDWLLVLKICVLTNSVTVYRMCHSIQNLFLLPVLVKGAASGIGMEIYAVEWGVNTSIPTETHSSCPGVSTQLSDSKRQLYTCQKVANSSWNISQRDLCFVSLCCLSKQQILKILLKLPEERITGF